MAKEFRTIRQAIRDRMEELDVSAKSITDWNATFGIHFTTIYRYLNEETDAGSEVASKMLKALGLKIVVDHDNKPKWVGEYKHNRNKPMGARDRRTIGRMWSPRPYGDRTPMKDRFV